MDFLEILANILLIIFITGGIATIGMTYYLGKHHVKEIDKVVYGHEFPNDSIFALFIRVPNYAGAFAFEWSARRSGLVGKIDKFDAKFRRPFIFTFWLMIVSTTAMIVGFIIEKTFLGM